MDGSRLPAGEGADRGWRLVTWLILGWTGLMGLLAYAIAIGAVGLAPAVSDLGAASVLVAGDAAMTLLIAGPMLALVVLTGRS